MGSNEREKALEKEIRKLKHDIRSQDEEIQLLVNDVVEAREHIAIADEMASSHTNIMRAAS